MKKLLSDEKQLAKIIFNILCVYFIVQPFFDVMSNLYNNGYYTFNIITYIKPLIVYGIFAVLFIFTKYKTKKLHFIYYVAVAVYIVFHTLLLYYIFVENSVILHELRFLINILYFVTLFFDIKIIYDLYEDKKKFFENLKKVLCVTIGIYVILYLIAVLTNTSWLTYEFSDSTKVGYRGWNYSGQIFGHFLSIVSPLIILKILDSKKNIFAKLILLSLFVTPFLLIGTKVPYYIIIIVFGLYIIVSIVCRIIYKREKIKITNVLISLIFMLGAIFSYKYLPVYTNMQINQGVAATENKVENMILQHKKDQEKIEEIEKEFVQKPSNDVVSNYRIRRIEVASNYNLWTAKSLDKLNNLYANGLLHSSDNRNRQLYYMNYKFNYSSSAFKLFGLGYLNQPNALSMERDIIMPLFSFGIIGFILLLNNIWHTLIAMIVTALKNIKRLDKEFIFLSEAFCMFFFISFYAGATYIYTQFANILVIVMVLLSIKIKFINNESNDEMMKNKKESSIRTSLRTITEKKHKEVLSDLEKNLKNSKKTFIVTANPETIMLAEKDKQTKEMLMDKKILKVPDGIAVVKACKKIGMDINERITGCDLSEELLELANKYKKSLYLFGSKDEVIKKMTKVIKEKYPNIKLLKAQDGYVKDREKIKKDIIKKQPDLCLVALGIPNQEKFIHNMINEVDKGIFMGVGGTFDVLSGSKQRAPKIFIKLNLEWLYRIACEPTRLKRFFDNNIKFMLQVYFKK